MGNQWTINIHSNARASPDPIVERSQTTPCGKVAEGLSTQKQDDIYWQKLGFVKDANTGIMRKMNTDEYDKVLKEKQVKKPEQAKKKGLSFTSFLGKGKR